MKRAKIDSNMSETPEPKPEGKETFKRIAPYDKKCPGGYL